MLSRMAPSSPPVKRTLHLLKTPDILLANDNRPLVSYQLINMAALLRYGRYLASPNDDYFAAGDINVGFTPNPHEQVDSLLAFSNITL
jgi:hypothetical protein